MKPSEVIKQLQATNSRLDKERILEEAWNAGCTDFFVGAKLACDGLVSFGVKQITEKFGDFPNMKMQFQDFMELATKLQKRELTGHAARDAINDFVDACDTNEWNGFYRLVLVKDLKSGLSESTINKVLKKIGDKATEHMVTEFPYQRCCLPKHVDMAKLPWVEGMLSQIKSDGMFANINHSEDGVDILSRAGQPFPLEQFESLVDNIKKTFPVGTQSHGEFLVFRDGKELPRQIGNGILNSVSNGGTFDVGDMPVYVIWDQIPITSVVSKGSYNVPYKNRLQNIIKQKPTHNILLVDTRIVHSMEEAIAHYREVLALGLEGTIIKDPNASWKDGTSKQQIKLKLEAECDLEIIGFNPGKGKNAELFGSIQCKTSDGLLEVGVSGFKDKKQGNIPTRAEIWAMKDQLIGTIMTVTSNSLMTPSSDDKKYSLFLPRFLEFRKDKSEADSLQKVKDQFESAISK